MLETKYRDNLAGALNHRAVGLLNMAKCGKQANMIALQLPCWLEGQPLKAIAAQAVNDLRQACTLRSAKYGSKTEAESGCKAYQAVLRNLADAMDVLADLECTGDKSMVSWCRQRADELALTDKKLLQACEASELTDGDARKVERDLRIASTAASSMPAVKGSQHSALCQHCKQVEATFLGYSCRCKCLCQACASMGSRVKECPLCGRLQ